MITWQQLVDGDLAWRRAELAALKLKLFQEKPKDGQPQSPSFKALLRAAWSMLYAHYEGFSLFLFSRYLDTLEKMKVRRGHCRPPLLLASLRHHFSKIRNQSEADLFSFLRDGYRLLLDEPVDFPRDKKRSDEFEIHGRSNLWPKLLKRCCEEHCIPMGRVNAADVRLRLLVGRRNDIAHGKDTPVKDFDEYDEYEQHVLEVMEAMASAFAGVVVDRSYLDPSVKQQETARMAYRIWQETGGDQLANWYEAERRLAEGEPP